MDSTDKYNYWNRVRGGKRPHVTEKTHLRQGKNARLDREEQNLLVDYCTCNWKNKHFEVLFVFVYVRMHVCVYVHMFVLLLFIPFRVASFSPSIFLFFWKIYNIYSAMITVPSFPIAPA